MKIEIIKTTKGQTFKVSANLDSEAKGLEKVIQAWATDPRLLNSQLMRPQLVVNPVKDVGVKPTKTEFLCELKKSGPIEKVALRYWAQATFGIKKSAYYELWAEVKSSPRIAIIGDKVQVVD
jgi:hypothetical protein